MALLLTLIVFPAHAFACPSCSETLNDGKKPNGLARGFAWSIGAMLLVPAALVGGGAFFIARGVRRNSSEAAREESSVADN